MSNGSGSTGCGVSVFIANLTAVLVLLIVALSTGGTPPFWLFVISITPILFTVQMLQPDLNQAPMRPLAHVAGTAAAMFGVIPGVLGALIGAAIDQLFNGTITGSRSPSSSATSSPISAGAGQFVVSVDSAQAVGADFHGAFR